MWIVMYPIPHGAAYLLPYFPIELHRDTAEIQTQCYQEINNWELIPIEEEEDEKMKKRRREREVVHSSSCSSSSVSEEKRKN